MGASVQGRIIRDLRQAWTEHEDIMTRKYVVLVALGFCLMALTLWVVSCARNPVTGRKELMLVSEGDELKLGQQTDAEIVQKYGLYEDAQLTPYLNGICKNRGKFSHRPHLNFQLKILDVAVVNAFAVGFSTELQSFVRKQAWEGPIHSCKKPIPIMI